MALTLMVFGAVIGIAVGQVLVLVLIKLGWADKFVDWLNKGR